MAIFATLAIFILSAISAILTISAVISISEIRKRLYYSVVKLAVKLVLVRIIIIVYKH